MASEPLGGEVTGSDLSDLDLLAQEGTGAIEEAEKTKALAEDDEDEEAAEPEKGTGEKDVPDREEPEPEPGDVEEAQEEDKEKDKEEPEEEKDEIRTVKAAEKKYPGLFKEFPDLRRAFFRDKQFSEIVSTPDELKEMAAKANVMDEYMQDIMSGSSERLLETIGETDADGYDKFVSNFLPTVEKRSPQLAGRIITPYIKRILRNAVSDAKDIGNKQLEYSVGHLSKYLFRSVTIPDDPPERNMAEHPEVVKARAEAAQAMQRVADSFSNRVFTAAEGLLTTEINKSVGADKRFSPIERRALAKEIFDKVVEELDRDQRHNKAMNTAWDAAKRAGHADRMITQVVNAFLGGARNRLQPVRARVIAAALKEKGVVVDSKGGPPATPQTGSPSKAAGGVIKSDQVDYASTSDDDILSGKITFKKARGR